MWLCTTVNDKMCTKCDFDTSFQTSSEELGMVLTITFNLLQHFTLMPMKQIMWNREHKMVVMVSQIVNYCYMESVIVHIFHNQ